MCLLGFFVFKCNEALRVQFYISSQTNFFNSSPIGVVEASALLGNVFNSKLLFDLSCLLLSYCSKLSNFLSCYLRKELFLRAVTGTDSLCPFSYSNKAYYKKGLVFSLLVLFIIYGFRLYSDILVPSPVC